MRAVMASVILSLVFYSSPARTADKSDGTIDRLAKVEDGFYRGARPTTAAQMATLKTYQIKTIINVSDDQPAQDVEAALAKAQGINLIYYPMHGWNKPKDQQTEDVQAMLNDPSLRPIYIHCKHGRERTGVMVALYRVFTNGWTAHEAYREMKQMGFRTYAWNFRKYFKRKSGYYDEEEAAESYTDPSLAMAAVLDR
jgi:protein tyrosine/serine phosphatase